MKAILGFTRMSVRGLNKVKRELGFVLMALNIRKVVAQKFIKDNFYIISIEIVFFTIQELYVPDPLVLLLIIGVHVVCYDLCYARFVILHMLNNMLVHVSPTFPTYVNDITKDIFLIIFI